MDAIIANSGQIELFAILSVLCDFALKKDKWNLFLWEIRNSRHTRSICLSVLRYRILRAVVY